MRVHKPVDLIKQFDVIRAVHGAVENDEIAAFFVDAYVEISHAARELFGKIQILCFGVPRMPEQPLSCEPGIASRVTGASSDM